MNKRLDLSLKIKSVDEKGTFSGYASVFGVKDSHDDIVQRGAFTKSLSERMPAMLWQHDTAEPIGVYTRVEEDEKGLYIEGKLLIDSDPLAVRAHGLLKENGLSGLSIGFRLVDWEYSADKDAYLLKEIELHEVSLVTFPSNDKARVENVKHSLMDGELPPPAQVERLLRDAGFSRQQAKCLLAKGYSSLDQREADKAAETQEIQRLIELMKV